jgi:hypothetical protein
MSDPVLDAHEIGDLIYLLSGPRPISIRDQMLRGLILAERLLENGIISDASPAYPLLVVGAGAGSRRR